MRYTHALKLYKFNTPKYTKYIPDIFIRYNI